ncbi:hypothetical protein LY78DRAFT_664671 [Colletotrichum sublineola]|nr:hypothetical protein LY78DRAFT_664671 [Colletotrichum sublineola]
MRAMGNLGKVEVEARWHVWVDVNAENVFIDTGGNAWVIDFGAATPMDELMKKELGRWQAMHRA